MARITIQTNPITRVTARAATVLHLTDPTVPGSPVRLGQSVWFNVEAAEEFAMEQSLRYPAPQRFAVYDGDDGYVASYQCGEVMPVFTVID